MGRLVQSISTIVLAALVVLGAAGTAWAAFSVQTATPKVTASTLSLQPPTGLVGSCQQIGNIRIPSVTFTGSASVGVVADHPERTPAQVFGYNVSLLVGGVADPNGASVLGAQVTNWTGPSLTGDKTTQVNIVTSYGSWTSAPATVTFQC